MYDTVATKHLKHVTVVLSEIVEDIDDGVPTGIFYPRTTLFEFDYSGDAEELQSSLNEIEKIESMVMKTRK